MSLQSNIVNKSILATQTANNSTSLQFRNISNLASTILITYQGVKCSATGSYLLVQFSNNRGSSYISSGYQSGITFSLYNDIGTLNLTNTNGFITSPFAGSPIGTFNGFLYIFNYNSSVNFPIGSGLGSVSAPNSTYSGFSDSILPGTTGVNAFSISFSSGNIVTGSFNVFLIS